MNVVRKFLLSVEVDDQISVDDLADALIDYLCDGGEGNVAFPEAIFSVDDVEPLKAAS